MCAHPFMRDASGNVRWWAKMTEEERLLCTPFPCGKCLPCKINRCRVWVHRMLLERKTSKDACFITLTYDDEHLPEPAHLDKVEFQKFLKRLRYYTDEKIRYFGCGEYGDKTNRPHYHACLFGPGPDSGDMIQKAWGQGFTMVGDFNKNTARYVTGYVVKKMTDKKDPRLKGKTPEFMLSSRKDGGLGIDAVMQIADQLKQNPYWTKEDILRHFQHGSQQLPLGRYLTSKLAAALGIPEEIFKKQLFEYQKELFEENVRPGENFYWNVVDQHKQERLSLEKKHKIYNTKRTM